MWGTWSCCIFIVQWGGMPSMEEQMDIYKLHSKRCFIIMLWLTNPNLWIHSLMWFFSSQFPRSNKAKIVVLFLINWWQVKRPRKRKNILRSNRERENFRKRFVFLFFLLFYILSFVPCINQFFFLLWILKTMTVHVIKWQFFHLGLL